MHNDFILIGYSKKEKKGLWEWVVPNGQSEILQALPLTSHSQGTVFDLEASSFEAY